MAIRERFFCELRLLTFLIRIASFQDGYLISGWPNTSSQDRLGTAFAEFSTRIKPIVGWIVGRKKPRILWQSTFFLEPRSSVRIVLRRRFGKPLIESRII